MKDDIKRNFSKGSKTYDDNANVQKYMIEQLLIELPRKDYKKILEIGCGTGLLTERLLDLYPGAQITAIDISDGMIDICKNKLRSNSIDFICSDIEFECPIDEFDLIISSATFQWMNDLESLLENLKSRLAFGGILAFSTFEKGTFKELDESLNYIFKKNNIDVKQERNYYSKEDLYNLTLKVFEDNNFYTSMNHMRYVEYFKDTLKFLKAIKAVGANSSLVSQFVTPNITKELIEYYNKTYKFSDISSISDEYINHVHATYYLLFSITERL